MSAQSSRKENGSSLRILPANYIAPVSVVKFNEPNPNILLFYTREEVLRVRSADEEEVHSPILMHLFFFFQVYKVGSIYSIRSNARNVFIQWKTFTSSQQERLRKRKGFADKREPDLGTTYAFNLEHSIGFT